MIQIKYYLYLQAKITQDNKQIMPNECLFHKDLIKNYLIKIIINVN